MKSPAGLRTELSRQLEEAVRAIWGDSVHVDFHPEVSSSDNLDFGDLSCSAAMVLAGMVRAAPREIARRIVEKCGDDLPGVAAPSIDGPGFINFRFSDDYLAGTCRTLADSGLGPLLPDMGRGRTALVEFVSSNPTGPLTVGHCRQAVLGDAVSRLLEAVGWSVNREYYYNDGGRQMKLLGESLAARYSGGGDEEIPEGGYRGEYLTRWARELGEVRGGGLNWREDRDTFIAFAEEKAMEMIRSDLALLGIDFDRYFAESELIPGDVERAIEELSIVHPDGRSLIQRDPEDPRKLWLRFTALGRPRDRVIRRADGSYTYRMPDIAYHLNKFRRGFHLIVDVFGADHLDTSRDVTAALKALLGEAEVSNRLRVVLHQFVTLLRGGERVKMSTRAGEYVTLAQLVAEAGSPDVTRYLFLTRRAEAHMDFDLDLARKESSENPVYYVQYAHARISGILRTAEEAGVRAHRGSAGDIAALLDGEHERELMRLLESVPVQVAAAAGSMEPHRLTEMLAELATGFHRFYQHVRVVDVRRPLLSSARLMLCESCRECISGILEILGVEAPERM
ncbi:MAG: arginine--tRNA ligase [Candidatus Aegiribacteria sp.]